MTAQLSTEAPAFRPFAVSVVAVQQLGAHFRRITFGGPDLDELGSGGADQRIKVLLPLPGRERPHLPEGPDWYGQWRGLPVAERCPMRTYTVRAARPERRELDVDFVLHGATGPASAWATRARPGDEVLVVGPNARHPAPGGVEWRPPAGAGALLLAGDETAVPAVSAVVEALPAGIRAHAVLEVPTAADVLPLDVAPGVHVRWVTRDDGPAQPHGARLRAAVLEAVEQLGVRGPGGTADELDPDGPVWEVPEADVGADAYVWLAGEAGVVTALRRHLLREAGLDRRAVAFMGYWRAGRGEGE